MKIFGGYTAYMDVDVDVALKHRLVINARWKVEAERIAAAQQLPAS